MMILSKEATSKDQQLKSQIVLSFQDDESKNTAIHAGKWIF